MRLAKSVDKQLIEAARDATGFCPSCDSPLVAKCGTIISPHWAHHARPDCDTWSEPESAWHLGWKNHAPPERTEVVMGAQREHRADVVLPDGRVLELQHSALSVEAIREREEFYTRAAGGMVWLWDASVFWHAAVLKNWYRSGAIILPRHRVLRTVGQPMLWDIPRTIGEAARKWEHIGMFELFEVREDAADPQYAAAGVLVHVLPVGEKTFRIERFIERDRFAASIRGVQ